MKLQTLFFIAALLLVGLGNAAEACPTCKLALENGADHSQQGYAYSIMFMMAMPFLIALGWTIFIVRSVIHQRKLDAELPKTDEIAFNA